jgi:phosphate/phosphite/phosphonate ABC transporter binding protein
MKKFSKLATLIAILIPILLTFVSCKDKSPVSQPISDQSSSSSSSSQTVSSNTKDTITISSIGLEDPLQMAKNFAPLCKYLSEKLGKQVVFKVESSYDKVTEDLKNNVVDIAALGPPMYVNAHDSIGVEPLVKTLEKGKPYFSITLFAKSSSNCKSIADLKGKKVAVSPAPQFLYLMETGGVKKSDLADLKVLNNQMDVIYSVLNGDCDAGGVKSSIFNKYNKNNLKEIGSYDKMPTFAYVVRKGLDDNIKSQIKDTLIQLNNPEILKPIDQSYTGFCDAKDADYQWMREVMHKYSK